MSHTTIPMRPPGAPKGVTVGIDAGIAKLIKAIWQADINTLNSCEDRAAEADPKPGIAWIQFASTSDLETFLDAVQGDGINHADWQIDFLIEDAAPEGESYYDHVVTASVRFPFKQTDELARRMRDYVQFLNQQEAA